jgi:hypothetical protein
LIISQQHFIKIYAERVYSQRWKIPPVVWPVKPGQDFYIFSSGGHFVQCSGTCWWCAQLGKVLITLAKFSWNSTKSLTCDGRTIFSIFTSGGHFVQRSGTCRWCAQLGMVLITPLKFGWNHTSSLTCEGRTILMRTDWQKDGQTAKEKNNMSPKVFGRHD